MVVSAPGAVENKGHDNGGSARSTGGAASLVGDTSSRLGLGERRHRCSCYLRGSRRAGHAEREESARPVRTRSGVLLEEESDMWVPPVGETVVGQACQQQQQREGAHAVGWAGLLG